MGGALLKAGNANSVVIVVDSHIPITMVGLDATEKCLITSKFLARLRDVETTGPILTAGLLHFYNGNSKRLLKKRVVLCTTLSCSALTRTGSGRNPKPVDQGGNGG